MPRAGKRVCAGRCVCGSASDAERSSCTLRRHDPLIPCRCQPQGRSGALSIAAAVRSRSSWR
eukprot:1133060-Prymnesium_polylepis.1